MTELNDHFPFKNTDKKWHAFFGAIYHQELKSILEIWNEYEIGQFVIAKEISSVAHKETAGEHIHFVAEMTPTVYHAFCKRVFKDKYKLAGQARGGKPRQYGKVNEIKDITRMIAYCLKDGDFVTNIPADELEKYKKVSFKKIEQKKESKSETFCEKVARSLENYRADYDWDFEGDAEVIIDAILDNLGMMGKVFDENQVKKFYYGVYNILKKTERQKSYFRQRIKLKVLDINF